MAAQVWMLLLLQLLLLGETARVSSQSIQCDSEQKSCTFTPWIAPWGDSQACTFASVVHPKTEQELVHAVAEAVRHGRKVKVTRGHPHSTPRLACPGSSGGSIISTEHFDASITVDADARTATLGAGTQLHDLLEALAEAGLALPSVPVWSFLSVVGFMSTGAHGSSHRPHNQLLHDRILSLRIVVPASAAEGHAKVLEIGPDSDPELLAAARISLGVLGAISQVTIRADRIFKRDQRVEHAGDQDLPDRVLSHARQSEFGEIFWFPSQRHAVFLHSNRVPVTTPGDDSYTMASLRPLSGAEVRTARAFQEAVEESGNRTQLCELAPSLILGAHSGPPLVGFSHRIQSSRACTNPPPGTDHFCLFEEPSLHAHETSFTMPASRIADYVRDVAALRDKRPDSLCGLAFHYGLWFRYIPGGSGALLGDTEDVVDANALYFRSAEASLPRLDQDVYDEIEQLAMVKYRGRPHWGKSNRIVSFLGTADKYGQRLERFVSVKQRLDPHGVFSSPWSDAVLGLGGTELNQHKPFCALEGLCICQEDEHCNPRAGYFCRPGLVFPQARVCRFELQSHRDEL